MPRKAERVIASSASSVVVRVVRVVRVSLLARSRARAARAFAAARREKIVPAARGGPAR
jgi:hypothetical protein